MIPIGAALAATAPKAAAKDDVGTTIVHADHGVYATNESHGHSGRGFSRFLPLKFA